MTPESTTPVGGPTSDPSARGAIDLAPGDTFGHFTIRRRLGSGGMGTVYEAAQPDGRIVALKVLTVDLAQYEATERFLREGRAAAAVNHPNTVYVYRAEEINGVPAISMELVDGGTLEDRVEREGPLPVADVVDYALDLIDGLAAAHDVGVLHRDVKPANCFLTVEGTLKIGDFGLSKPTSQDEQLRLTRTGMFLGTPVYSSPEQLLGEPLDVRSDIYAVGLTLYFALTGKLPFNAGSMMQVIASVVNGAPTPIATYRPDLPAPLAAVVMKAIARAPDQRFQSYEQLRAAVAALRPSLVLPATPRQRLGPWLVDATIVAFFAQLLWVFVRSRVPSLRQTDPRGPDPLASFAYLLFSFLIVAVPEAWRGASPGKRLFGLRVVGPDGKVPALWRTTARCAILWISFPLWDLASWLTHSFVVAFGTMLVARGVVLMSPRNSATGWRTLYDRLTRTRVIRSGSTVLRRRRQSFSGSAPARLESRQHIGPYLVIAEESAPLGCVCGWDPTLNREVWIHQSAAGDTLSEARRAVARPTRLRWIGAGRHDEKTWNAFSAIGGEPFLRRIERPVHWQELRQWIEDLCDELIAAEADASLSFVPSPEMLWIAPDDSILIADTGAEPAVAAPVGSGRDLVTSVVSAVRASKQLQPGIPAFAARALDSIVLAPDVHEMRAVVASLADRPTTISSPRRAWMLVVQLLPIVIIPAFVLGVAIPVERADPVGVKLDRLVSYVGDTVLRATPRVRRPRISVIPNSLGLTKPVGSTEIGPNERALDRRYAEIYIANVLGDRARDTTTRRLNVLTPAHARLAAAIAGQFAHATPTEVAAARRMVDTLWNGTPPSGVARISAFSRSVVNAALAAAIIGVCTLLMALLFRRGPVMRYFNAELVTASGQPAGRLQIAARHALVIVAAAATLYLVVAYSLSGATGDRVTVLGMVVLGAMIVGWAVYLWQAVRHPPRSGADMVAGTYLVPR